MSDRAEMLPGDSQYHGPMPITDREAQDHALLLRAMISRKVSCGINYSSYSPPLVARVGTVDYYLDSDANGLPILTTKIREALEKLT